MAVPNVIYDADMSSDHDDVGDMATIFGLQLLGEINLIGMGVSSTNGATSLYMNAVSTYYGYPNIPVGVRPDVGGNGGYPATVASQYPHPLYASSADCPLAASLYRQLLASSPDNSVVIVTGGYLDNIEALLQTGADQYSSLTGMELVTQKVYLLACAGGGYPEGAEFNFTVSPTAAQYVVNNWPTAATYVPDDVGRRAYTGGLLPLLPNHNPIREVYVDVEVSAYNAYPQDIGAYPYPSWTQQTIVQAFRGYTGSLTKTSGGNFWNPVTYGYNHVFGTNEKDTNGNSTTPGQNEWYTDHDVSGAQEQEYFEDQAWIPVTDSINALINLLPSSLNTGIPGSPSDLCATVVSGSQINLSWIKNSFDETGFVIEKFVNGYYTQIGTVGAGVTSFSATGLSSTANVSFRVKAVKSGTSSLAYAYVWVYSGWTEYNFGNSDSPLYQYYQTCGLRWNLGGDDTPNHVTVNNDSTHGQTLTVNVLAGALGSQGYMYLYFFYQDENNWYRVNHSVGYEVTTVVFEKCIAGTITTVGTSSNQNDSDGKTDGTNDAISNGSPLRQWQLIVTPAGSIDFYTNGILRNSATDTLSFSSGKLGLGGYGKTPVWQNFNFDTSGAPAPAAPTNISVTPANNQNTISWTASPSATSYNVFCGTGSGSENLVPVAIGITGTSYTDTAVTNGTTYYYTVQSVNAFRNSSKSSEASATPAASGSAPSAPTGLTGNAGNGQVSLSWGASSGATSYSVYRGTSSGGESSTAIATGVGTNSYTDTGLTNGTTYYYTVQAVDSNGSSGSSNEASATPTAGGSAPSAPTGLSATAGVTQASLSWTAVSGATSYNVYRGTSSGGENSTPIATGLTSPSYTDSGLTGGTTYYYTVAAVNGYGTSGYSNQSSATPTSGSAPAAPTNLVASSGNGEVILSWTTVTGATSYSVYSGTSSGGENSTAIATGLTSGNYTNTGLTNGIAYYYTVKAVNTYGTSGASNEATATPAAASGGPAFVNPSFETPTVAGYSDNPSGSGWTFTNNGGIQANGSAYSGSANVAPDGTQTAFLQGNGSLSTMSQSVNFPAGTYTISFYAARRGGNQIQPIQVSVDGTAIGTYTPTSGSFTQFTTASFTVTSGNHTVSFAATVSSSDLTSFLDLLSIATVSSGGSGGGGGAAGSSVSQVAYRPLALSAQQSSVRTGVADSNYTMVASDSIVGYTALTASRTVSLPAAGSAGRHIIVKDESGSCSSGTTITVSGTIDGSGNVVLSTAYAVAAFYDNGTNWMRLV